MIVIMSAVAGGLWGGFLAKRRGGTRLDIAQYAGSFGIAFAIIGLFATVFLQFAFG